MAAQIIAVANQKGGVGKTTTCVNLASAFASMKARVILLDMDPQANATTGCGIESATLEHTAYHVLLGRASMTDTLVKPEGLGFKVLPANSDLTAAEVELLRRGGEEADLEDEREFALKRAINPLIRNHDWIFIDCPPSLNMLTLNALAAADSVLIPMQCEYYALEGLSALIETIEQVRASVNPYLRIEGLVRTMYDGRNNLATAVSDQLIENFGQRVYRTLVPRNVRVAEAPSYGLPVLHYDPTSKGAIAYLSLAGEMLRRSEKRGSA